MPKVQHSEIDAGRGRPGHSRRVMSTLAEINVVPLVDVMLVLLIIFMVTAPMMQRGLDVNLPVARRAEPITSQRVFVSVPLSYRTDRVVQIDDRLVRIEILQEQMRQMMKDKPDRQVFLRGDGRLTVQELLDVMDLLKAGGVEKVGIVTKLPGER